MANLASQRWQLICLQMTSPTAFFAQDLHLEAVSEEPRQARVVRPVSGIGGCARARRINEFDVDQRQIA
jgi:hypothetical protein